MGSRAAALSPDLLLAEAQALCDAGHVAGLARRGAAVIQTVWREAGRLAPEDREEARTMLARWKAWQRARGGGGMTEAEARDAIRATARLLRRTRAA